MAGVGEDPLHESFWQTYKVPILLGSSSILLIVFSLYLLIKTYQVTDPIQFTTAGDNQATLSAAQLELIIDVSGAVKNPGVYRLAFGSRVDDAIEAAGGMTKDADLEKIAATINRAARVSDGSKVFIPGKKNEPSTSGVSANQSGSDPSSTTVVTVSINSASLVDLERLNGIGPATAKKIIAGRPYARIEELVEKKAISQNLFEKLKIQLTL